MKSNKTTVILTAVIILVSAIVLTACMSALAEEEVNERTLERIENVDPGLLSPEQAKTPQADMNEKFGQFSHSGEGTTLVLYNENQFAAVEAKKANGERFYITEEEFDYLVSDTMRIYMEYDEIVLTNAMKLAAFGFINDPDYDTQAFFDRNKSKLVFDGDDVIIRPQHRDGIYYNGEYTELSAMEQEITSILLYRVEMSDSGLLPGDHETKLGITAENNFVSDKFIPGQINKPVSVWSSDKVESHLRGAALIFDEGAFDGNEYEKALSFGWTQDGNAGRSYFNASGMSGVIFSTYYFTKVDQNGEQFSAVEGTEQITPYIHGGFHDLWYYEYTFDSECLCDNESRTPVLDSAEYDIQTGDTLKELTAKYGIPFIQYINVFTGEYSNIDFDSTGHNIKTVYYVSEDGKLFTVRLAPSDNGSQNDYTVYEVVITDIR